MYIHVYTYMNRNSKFQMFRKIIDDAQGHENNSKKFMFRTVDCLL